MRYLHNNPETTYSQLIVAARNVEVKQRMPKKRLEQGHP